MYRRVVPVVALALVLLTAFVVSRSQPPGAAVSTPAAAQTAAATFAVPAMFAVTCGTPSDRVARTQSANATFLLNSPGRPPLKIAVTGNAPVEAAVPGGYHCVLLDRGVPFPVTGGLIGPYMPGFVSEGTFPATTANPAPTGFVLPQTCAFVAPPGVGQEQTEWSVDCGAENNNKARATLGAPLTQQGWTLCGSGLATAQWKKDGVMLSVAESTLAPGDYPRLIQRARLLSPC